MTELQLEGDFVEDKEHWGIDVWAENGRINMAITNTNYLLELPGYAGAELNRDQIKALADTLIDFLMRNNDETEIAT